MRAWVKAQGGSLDSPRHLTKIAKHVEAYADPYSFAHVAASLDLPPIHILEVPPSASRLVTILITAGMSNLPMIPPPGAGMDLAWAEVMLCLPPDWPLDRKSLRNKRNAWPLRLLKDVARYPHEYDKWVWYHHTFAYGDEERPFPGTRFGGVLFHVTGILPEEFWCLPVGRGREVHFLSVVPLYPDEVSFCRARGAHALLDLFEDAGGVPEVVNPNRPSVLDG